MREFKDGAGREWSVSLDVFLVEQVATKTGVHIGQLLDNAAAGFIELLRDPVKFVRVLWVLCEEQGDKHGIKPEQFGRGLFGDPLEDAAGAFSEALADFCPRQQRMILRKLLVKGREVAEKQTAVALKLLDEADHSIFSAPATNLPELLESTPQGAD